MSFDVPRSLLYTIDDIWILVEENVGIIGVTDYGQSEFTGVVFIELPNVGSEVVQASPFGIIEAMETSADLISPVSGKVLEINNTLESEPEQVNYDHYGDGWIIKVDIHNIDEIDGLLTPQEYEMYISGEGN